jgi:hypothetical protein
MTEAECDWIWRTLQDCEERLGSIGDWNIRKSQAIIDKHKEMLKETKND